MATSKEYLGFILEQLSDLGDVAHRAMMGEYVLYYRGKVIGGIYNNRFLIKAVPSALSYMRNVTYELPYEGGKPMLLVDDVTDKPYLTGLLQAIYDELPQPAPKKKRKMPLLPANEMAEKPYLTGLLQTACNEQTQPAPEKKH